MKISITSDVHVVQSNDSGKKFLEAFLRHDKVKNSDMVVFLGDIFDIMIGPKEQYLKKYDFFFNGILNLANNGVKIIYIEGNHDFHLSEVFKKLNNKNIQVVRDKFSIEDNSKKIVFEHGDDLDLNNTSYQKWKRIYSSNKMRLFVKYIVPHFVIDYIGNKASNNSKGKSASTFDYEKEKSKYRDNFDRYDTQKADIFVMGHTHIKDEYVVSEKVYLNNGFPRAHQEFLYLEDARWSWVKV